MSPPQSHSTYVHESAKPLIDQVSAISRELAKLPDSQKITADALQLLSLHLAFERHKAQLSEPAKFLLDQAGSIVREIAKLPIDMVEPEYSLTDISEELRKLEKARAGARAILGLYENLPWLKSVRLVANDVWESIERITAEKIETHDGRQISEKKFDAELAKSSSTLRSQDFDDLEYHSIFNDDSESFRFLLSLNPESETFPLRSIETNRDMLRPYLGDGKALDAEGEDPSLVDALAAALFPEAWAEISASLDLPTYTDEQSTSSPRPRG